jgi:hypothetical protein
MLQNLQALEPDSDFITVRRVHYLAPHTQRKLEILNLKPSPLFLPLMSSATHSRHLKPSNLLDPATTLLHDPLCETEPDTESKPEPELKSKPEPLTFERTLRTPKPMDLLTMNPVPVPAKPVWNPKDKNAPLKEDYVQFYQDTLQYHYHMTSFVIHSPELHVRIPALPNQLESFTDKAAILVGVANLHVHVEQLTTMHIEGVAESAARSRSLEPDPTTAAAPRPREPCLKAALPTTFDGTTARARTFLAECRAFMRMNLLSFPDDNVRILWTLQLCSDKSANWKRIQMELMEGNVRPPSYLRDWDDFQTEFLLKWADMNSQKKAHARFLAGLKQTTSVRRYAEIFKDLALKADFTDLTILHTVFYEGLKWDVRHDMVSKTPDTLVELKALVIQLDEERMGADRRDNRTTTNRTPTTNLNEPAHHAATSVKAKVAHIRTSLSTDDCA